MRRMLVVFVVVIGVAAGLWAQTNEQQKSVIGVYLCEGHNPDGSPYVGMVEISAVKDVYLVHWQFGGQPDLFGVGLFREGVLAVSYFGGAPAVALYRPDGERLVGHWTIGGTDGLIHGETLTRMKPGTRMPDVRPRDGQPTPDARPNPRRPSPPVGGGREI